VEYWFFNQCIQKKGLCDFNVVVLVGVCEGSLVLAVMDLPSTRVVHKLQFRGEGGVQDMESGYESGACQYSVVSLMIDKLHTELCTGCSPQTSCMLSTSHLGTHSSTGNSSLMAS
jgi:hypothetical protein